MNDEKNALGKKLKELRELKGLSQVELSQKTKIARTSITMIEAGQRYPSEKTLDKIIEKLEIRKEEVFTEEVRIQAIKQMEEAANSFKEKASTDDIIRIYRKMVKDE